MPKPAFRLHFYNSSLLTFSRKDKLTLHFQHRIARLFYEVISSYTHRNRLGILSWLCKYTEHCSLAPPLTGTLPHVACNTFCIT